MVRKKKDHRKVKSKKLTLDGITFQSSLEAYMYKALKAAKIRFRYEGKSYETFKGFTLKGECYRRYGRRSKKMTNFTSVSPISYTPDFIGIREEWFIEVKGRANEQFPLRWKLFKKMIHEEALAGKRPYPTIFKPGSQADCDQVVEILIQKGYGKK